MSYFDNIEMSTEDEFELKREEERRHQEEEAEKRRIEKINSGDFFSW